MTTRYDKSWVTIVGPGILYAAAAVGVSHLVQATRAGAHYGLGLGLIIILACLIKYPSLRFGGDYAAATGKTLIRGYRDQGRAAFSLFALVQIFSMLFVVPAITLFTAGLIQVSLGFKLDNITGTALLLGLVSAVLISGRYHLLEAITKVMVGLFTALILFATVLVAVQIDWSVSAFVPPSLSPQVALFLIALVGFMPTPIDGSILQSIWTVARQQESGVQVSAREAKIDFNTGFALSVVLALCFMILGAGVMHVEGVTVASGNFGFAAQLIELFTQTLGAWSFPLIAAAAVFVMLSTLMTVSDGMSRILVEIHVEAQLNSTGLSETKRYTVAVVFLWFVSLLVVVFITRSFTAFMDATAVLVFLISPILATLNHRAMFSAAVPIEQQPSSLMRYWSLLAITLLCAVATSYFYFRWWG